MASSGVGQPFNRQYPSGFTFPINEEIFRSKDPKNFKEYERFRENYYEGAVGEGRTPPNIARERANIIARQNYFEAAVKVGAAVDPTANPTASTAPVPESSRPRPLSTTTPRPITTPRPPPPPPSAPRPKPQPDTKSTPNVGGTNRSTANSNVSPNILHNYVNYTYNIKLYALSTNDFNQLVSRSGAKIYPKLLVSSGGSGKNKDKNFDLDFYFEDLDVSTIISPTVSNRETNAYDVNFTIFEPNGCTLIDRLIGVTKDLAPDGDNYITMPYLLEIGFLGYDEAGKPAPVNIAKKTIPVYLTEMKIKPNLDGTRYMIRAQPFNQNALTQTSGTVPVNCEIKAETIEALFKSTGTIGTGVSDALRRGSSQPNANQKPISASSLADLLNEWQEYLVENNMIEVADEYNFVFAREIAVSPVELPQLKPAQDVPINDNPKGPTDSATIALLNARRAGIAGSSAGVGVTRIFAGSSIAQILAYAVRHCTFILDQLPEDGVTPQTPANNTDSRNSSNTGSSRRIDLAPDKKEEEILKWFWITPKVEIKKFDRLRNNFAKKITYNITVYESPNPRYPGAPQGQAREYVKEYDYWYTGKNNDILNVDINFDTAFYTSVSLYNSGPLRAEVTPPLKLSDTNTNEESKKAADRVRLLAKTGLPFPLMTFPSKQLADINAQGGTAAGRKTIAADDLAESLMSRSRGDMVTMRLEILGDPDFIKQDGIFGEVYPQGTKKVNGSLVTNQGRVIVNFKFKYPTDWTKDRGLLTANANKTVFEGLYGVVKVESKFERGVFKQVLDLYRLADSQYSLITFAGKPASDKTDNSLIDTGV